MIKFSKFILSSWLALGMVACGGSGGGGGGNNGGDNSTKNLPTYGEAETLQDSQNLNSTEKSLEDVGLKFKMDFEMKNGVSTTTYKWDTGFLEKFLKSHPATTNRDWMQSLENYLTVAKAYLQKYGSRFNLKKNDGTVTAVEMVDTVKKEIEAKVDVANQTIENLKRLDASGKPGDQGGLNPTSLDVCRLKSTSDILATSFDIFLNSRGREVYKNLFDSQKACSNTDSACLVKSGGDIVKTHFELELNSRGQETYSKLFDAFKACSATDVNCLVKSQGDIVVAQFEQMLTSQGREVYAKELNAYRACPAADINCLIKAQGDIVVAKFGADLTTQGKAVHAKLFEAYEKCGR